MTLLRKSVLTGIITIVAIVAGFIFLLKGCLAKYDERFMKAPALVFMMNNKPIVFSIVEFQKTTSYSQKGGSTRKSVSTHYFIQTNDGQSAALVSSKKIKGGRDIKNYPVETVGAAHAAAWIFMGELMAFDPFTLNRIADTKILEQQNPALKGNLPEERRFYFFNTNDSNIYFTARDGTKWKLDTRTLEITSSAYQKGPRSNEEQIALLKEEEDKLKAEMDSLYLQKNSRAVTAYTAKKISPAEFRQLTDAYYRERKQLYARRDSIRQLLSKWERAERKATDLERTIESLQRINPSFTHVKQNQDTAAGKWFGLYSEEELVKLYDRVSDQPAYTETVRRKIFSSTYSYTKEDDALINKKEIRPIGTVDFLDAGFLVNKKTGKPIRLTRDQSFLIIHKEQVGNKGKIILTSISPEGNIAWNSNTQLTEWTDWALTGEYLIIFGVNNKNLGSSESNILRTINLNNGSTAAFDFFTNKMAAE